MQVTLNYPHIAASFGAEFIDEDRQIVTHKSINVGTSTNPEYHWKRNPEFSVVRNLTATDEARLIEAQLKAEDAKKLVKSGLFCDMVNDYEALLYTVEEPDPAINALLGGGYYQLPESHNWVRIGIYNDTVTDQQIIDAATSLGCGIAGTGILTGITPSNTGSEGSMGGPITIGESEVIIEDNTITFTNDAFYQVQAEDGIELFFEGSGPDSITVPDGSYIIINHTTDERLEGILIPLGSSSVNPGGSIGIGIDGGTEVGSFGVIVTDNVVTVPDGDYYQILNGNTFDQVESGNGPFSIALPNGIYSIINLDTDQRVDNVTIDVEGNRGSVDNPINNAGPAKIGNLEVFLDDDNLSLNTEDYYQIQNVDPQGTYWEGNGPANINGIPPNVYNIINISTGERVNNVDIPAGQSEVDTPVDTSAFNLNSLIPGLIVNNAQNSIIVLTGDDTWQILNSEFMEIWQGVKPHAEQNLPNGTYHVLNLTRMERIDNVEFVNFNPEAIINNSILGISGGATDETNAEFEIVNSILNLTIDHTNNRIVFNDASPNDNDYWQILDSNFINVWDGNSPHTENNLSAGTYSVLNFTRMQRIDDIVFS